MSIVVRKLCGTGIRVLVLILERENESGDGEAFRRVCHGGTDISSSFLQRKNT
jgi:hypothetical protein